VKKGSKKVAKKTSTRKERLIDDVARGKKPAQAAKDAGFSKSYSRVNVYRELAKTSIQERIAEKRAALSAQADVEAGEIIGALAGQMRGDLADIVPEDEILRQAKERGVSPLIKKLKTHTRFIPQKGHDKDGNPLPSIREVTHEFELYSAQEAAKQLASIKGLLKEPGKNPENLAREAYERLRREFIDIPDETIRRRVAERYGVQESVLIH
jgi:phage terminase small subunit